MQDEKKTVTIKELKERGLIEDSTIYSEPPTPKEQLEGEKEKLGAGWYIAYFIVGCAMVMLLSVTAKVVIWAIGGIF